MRMASSVANAPRCSQLFRVDADEYEALPDDLQFWCVYCGHHDDHSEFVTRQQLDRAMRAAGDLGEQIIGLIAEEGVVGVCRLPRSPARIFTLDCTPVRATRRAPGRELCTVVAIA